MLSPMSVTQAVEIPADHRVYLDFEVPPEIPVGATARFEIRWFPRKEAVNNLDATLEEIWALCKDAPVTVDSFLEERRRDNEIKEERYRQFFSKSGDDNWFIFLMPAAIKLDGAFVTADHADFGKIEKAESIPFFWFR